MSIRIFKSALIRQQLSQQELDDLAADFLSYKKDGVLPDTFGRDAPYDDDRTYPLVKEEQVAHIHLADADAPFPKFLRQFKRTSDQAHLVYCQGAMDPDAYLLIIILKPEAHKMARNNNHMHKIGMMAEAFRMKH
ncbi:toxin YafO [Klebsiella variicola]|uniref:Putative toxin of the YafO-YafN toxin-antitoxin system n=1 Tax=Klebsiella grimontii TaxID=2058152 RepID=A0A285AZ62_9ENTR|nr:MULTISPECIES: type II toxin-antitoxin system YafO family toxin [Enterobacterales]EEE1923389.1 type II toxin-antitoxin system YafO family toxin [Salmonella enterica subsp. diarizonae]EGY4554205.1 type II toxin-antitoxin system YafO family toxin [Salmonella enterica]EGY5273731.1 type II toxin-antitoxin system YafO family toxin [Salmonella enterica]MDD9251656.1 type II toxin-antitoxin system YafO family toxin [Klebsiella variicola]SNU33955.1 putative toxin of the YafO-YafN toxin-antitoxin syst